MLNEKVCFSVNIDNLKQEYCTTTSELFNNRSLYIMLERFCNVITKENADYNAFLNTYFNDEGYVDVWRIPHILMDLVTGNCTFHSNLLNDSIFRTKFLSLLGDFYNYCISNSGLFLMDQNSLKQFDASIIEMRKNQCVFNLIADTFCKVIEQLKNNEETTQ